MDAFAAPAAFAAGSSAACAAAPVASAASADRINHFLDFIIPGFINFLLAVMEQDTFAPKGH